MKKLSYVHVSFIIYTAIQLFFLTKYPIITSDEIVYTEPSWNFLHTGRFASYLYPNLGGDYELSSVIQHGTIPLFCHAFFFKLLGLNPWSLRMTPFLSGLLLLVLIYKICERLLPQGGKTTAFPFYITAMLALSHVFVFASHSARPDGMVALFVAGSLYALLRESPLIAGLIAGMAMEVHVAGIIAPVALLGLAVGVRAKLKDYAPILLGVILGWGAWFVSHVAIDPDLFFRQMQSFGILASPGVAEWHRWVDFFWVGAYHRNMIFLVLLIWTMTQAFRVERYRPILGIIIGCMAGFLVVPSKNPQYIIFVFPYFLLLFGAFVQHVWNSEKPIKWRLAVFMTAALPLFMLAENVEMFKFWRCSYTKFIEKVKSVVPRGSTVLASNAYWPGLQGYCVVVSNEMLFYKMLADAKHIPMKEIDWSKIDYVIADTEVMEGTLYQDKYILPHIKLNNIDGAFTDDFYNFSKYMNRKSKYPLATRVYGMRP